MNIYIGHSSSFDYEKRLYKPLKNSELNNEEELVFPHENTGQLFNSKDYLKNECDLFIAEVSEPSTGLGIELGWADMYDVPIVCVHTEGSEPSSSLSEVSETVKKYRGSEELVNLVDEVVEKNR